MPTASAPMEMRPPSRALIASMNPSPISPSTFADGTRQSSSTSSAVSLTRMPSLFSFFPGRMPGRSISTANAVMPRFWLLRSVTARTTEMFA